MTSTSAIEESQTELGEALDVSFQQIQKYEQGKNAIASRIADLCRALQMTPNGLFGVSAKMGELSKVSSWTMRTALRLEDASPAVRRAVDAVLGTAPHRGARPV